MKELLQKTVDESMGCHRVDLDLEMSTTVNS